MTRSTRAAALAAALLLPLAGLVAPAHAALPAAERPDACVEPAGRDADGHESGAAARGRDGSRALDHREVSASEKQSIERQTERILAAKGKGKGNGGPNPGGKPGDGSDQIVIPTYVHVMAAEDGTGDVTDQQVDLQIDKMNQGFGGGESGPAVETGFRFELKDVRRYSDDKWHIDQQTKKYRSETRVGGAETLNIWVVEFPYLGIAQFPWDYDKNSGTDGVRVLWSSLPGGTETNYNEGDTATHEVGHWLGLFHTFDGGCSPENDGVNDTPAQSSPTGGCPEGRDSCDLPGLDPIHNYMDYSYDSCLTEFTEGQTLRMQDMYAAYRA